MLTVPFAAKLGTTLGAALDGVIYGALPKVAPASALSEAHLAPLTSVYRGNADASGGVNWTDVTVAANNDTAGDVSLFDATNPTKDMLCVELSSGDVIGGISLLVSTAAAITGTPGAEVRYRTATGWGTAAGVVTPALTSTGLKTVSFNDIAYSAIAPTDNVLDPFNGGQQRCLYLRFTGITAVTTAPVFTRVWKNISHDAAHKSINYTAAVAQGANPDFSALQAAILPVTDDLTLMGFDAPIVRLHPTIYRPTAAGLGAREWVYSKADGTFAALPTANINDPSALLSAALGSASATSTNLTSTDTSAGWSASGVRSTTTLTGNGYLEFEVGTGTTLPGFIGFNAASNSPDTLGYGNIQYSVHVGSGNSANAAVWATTNTIVSAFPIVAGDKFRLTRTGTNLVITHNGATKHTFASVATVPWVIDTALISLCAIKNIILVDTSGATPVPLAVTWGTATAVTVAAGAAQTVTWPITHQINITPPADWGKTSKTDTGDVAHNRYWLGWRHTSNTATPVMPVNFTVRGQPVMGAGVDGIPAPEATTYTSATVVCRETSTASETLMLVNGTTGKTATITVPANTAVATAAVSMPVAKGDDIVLVHAAGSGTNAIGDGALFLS